MGRIDRCYDTTAMGNRSHEITCPCCGAEVTVDAETGAVLSHVPPAKPHLSFEEAALEVRQEKKKTESKFARAMEDRSRRSEILEKKFRKAAEKAADDPDRPPNPLDFD
jgi:hypothetical protein